jgi:hypothetical protein
MRATATANGTATATENAIATIDQALLESTSEEAKNEILALRKKIGFLYILKTQNHVYLL